MIKRADYLNFWYRHKFVADIHNLISQLLPDNILNSSNHNSLGFRNPKLPDSFAGRISFDFTDSSSFNIII